MEIDLVRMRAKVRKPLGLDIDDPDLTNDDIDEYLNLSYWEIQDKFPFREKERMGTFVTVAGEKNYEMPRPFEALKQLSVRDPVSGIHTPLDPMDSDEYERVYIDGENEWGKPEKYLREDCYARLWPTPDQAYTMVIRRLITLADLSESQLIHELPRIWTEIIILGAQWRAFFDFGDFNRSTIVKNYHVAQVNSITPQPNKELGDTSRAGLEVLGREY